MLIQRRWGFGLGTIFSLIVVYFIFLYSQEKGWGILAFISKWYLIVVIGFIALSFAFALLIIIISLLMLSITWLKLHKFSKRHPKQKRKDFVDAEYTIKE